MKIFQQLNDRELVELTQDQIDQYVKLKKAETGIKIINEPETPVYQDVPERDLELFEVNGYNFKDRAAAEEIASVINKHISSALKVDYDYYRGGSDYKYASAYSGSLETVNVLRVYSSPVYQSIKDILASNKKIKEAWEKVHGEYEDENTKASEIVEGVYEAIRQARERLEKFRTYKIHIVEYLQLANGDRDIAWNFFDKAYAIEPSVKSMIMESAEYNDAINTDYITA